MRLPRFKPKFSFEMMSEDALSSENIKANRTNLPFFLLLMYGRLETELESRSRKDGCDLATLPWMLCFRPCLLRSQIPLFREPVSSAFPHGRRESSQLRPDVPKMRALAPRQGRSDETGRQSGWTRPRPEEEPF